MKGELWVEFELTGSDKEPDKHFCNGALVAAPFSTLEVKLDKVPKNIRGDNLLLYVRGAHNEKQVLPLSKDSSSIQTLRYYINKNLETEIGLHRLKNDLGFNPIVSSLAPFGDSSQFTISLPMEKDKVDLLLNRVDSSELDMKVRLNFDIPADEKAFLLKRKVVVASALQKVLKLQNPLDPTQVPTVAVVCSGGGTRAMTGMYGSLKGLQSLGLLDVITYMTSVSGSTWTTASLYSNPQWSKLNLDEAINSQKKKMPPSLESLFSRDKLQYYHSELQDREDEGYLLSLIDLWGLVIEQIVFGKKQKATLSDQKKAVSEGQNPLPIYTAVNRKQNASGTNIYEWCEFTPFEVGFSKQGAFVPVENFGSEFYLGRMVKKQTETPIAFLMGIWSSVFSADLKELWKNHIKPSSAPQPESANEEDKNDLIAVFSTLRKVAKSNTSSIFNFLRGLFLHSLYPETPDVTTSAGTNPDAFPDMLNDPILTLVDSGFNINIAFPPVLQPKRCADVIVSLSYSWDKDPLQVVKDTQKYCTKNKLPFPKIDFSKYTSQPEKEVYVFTDETNPDAPTVLHFPLVNVSFKDYKAPGVKRDGKKELEEGKIDVSIENSPYKTSHIVYSEEEFQRLVDLTSYNIANNKETIMNTLKKACEKKKTVRIPPVN